MPFQSTSVCVDAAPRVKSDVALPAEPVRLTASPGTSRRTSATSRAARSSMSFFVTTVTAAGVDWIVSGTSEAVTTMRSEIFWVARKRMNRKFMPSSSLRRGTMRLTFAAVGLLASGSSFPRSLPADWQWGASRKARVVAGYSGGGRAGVGPASRSPKRTGLLKNLHYEAGIVYRETVVVHFNICGEAGRAVVANHAISDALVRLIERLQRERRKAQPRRAYVADRAAADRQEVCRRTEVEVDVDAAAHRLDFVAVQQPALAVDVDADVDLARADEAAHDCIARAPRIVADDFVRQRARAAFEFEHGRAGKSRSGHARRPVPSAIEAAPENFAHGRFENFS